MEFEIRKDCESHQFVARQVRLSGAGVDNWTPVLLVKENCWGLRDTEGNVHTATSSDLGTSLRGRLAALEQAGPAKSLVGRLKQAGSEISLLSKKSVKEELDKLEEVSFEGSVWALVSPRTSSDYYKLSEYGAYRPLDQSTAIDLNRRHEQIVIERVLFAAADFAKDNRDLLQPAPAVVPETAVPEPKKEAAPAPGAVSSEHEEPAPAAPAKHEREAGDVRPKKGDGRVHHHHHDHHSHEEGSRAESSRSDRQYEGRRHRWDVGGSMGRGSSPKSDTPGPKPPGRYWAADRTTLEYTDLSGTEGAQFASNMVFATLQLPAMEFDYDEDGEERSTGKSKSLVVEFNNEGKWRLRPAKEWKPFGQMSGGWTVSGEAYELGLQILPSADDLHGYMRVASEGAKTRCAEAVAAQEKRRAEAAAASGRAEAEAEREAVVTSTSKKSGPPSRDASPAEHQHHDGKHHHRKGHHSGKSGHSSRTSSAGSRANSASESSKAVEAAPAPSMAVEDPAGAVATPAVEAAGPVHVEVSKAADIDLLKGLWSGENATEIKPEAAAGEQPKPESAPQGKVTLDLPNLSPVTNRVLEINANGEFYIGVRNQNKLVHGNRTDFVQNAKSLNGLPDEAKTDPGAWFDKQVGKAKGLANPAPSSEADAGAPGPTPASKAPPAPDKPTEASPAAAVEAGTKPEKTIEELFNEGRWKNKPVAEWEPVLFPGGSWGLDDGSGLIWCQADDDGFCVLPVVGKVAESTPLMKVDEPPEAVERRIIDDLNDPDDFIEAENEIFEGEDFPGLGIRFGCAGPEWLIQQDGDQHAAVIGIHQNSNSLPSVGSREKFDGVSLTPYKFQDGERKAYTQMLIRAAKFQAAHIPELGGQVPKDLMDAIELQDDLEASDAVEIGSPPGDTKRKNHYFVNAKGEVRVIGDLTRATKGWLSPQQFLDYNLDKYGTENTAMKEWVKHQPDLADKPIWQSYIAEFAAKPAREAEKAEVLSGLALAGPVSDAMLEDRAAAAPIPGIKPPV